MYSLISPYIGDIVTAIAGLVTVVVIAMLKDLRKRVLLWIDSKNDLRQQELIRYFAEQGFSYIESNMKSAKGKEKLNKAVEYVADKLESKKINVNISEVKAEIERTVQAHNKSVK